MTKPQPNITCTACGYSWNTKSKLILVSCPSCKHNIKNTTLKATEMELFTARVQRAYELEKAGEKEEFHYRNTQPEVE